MTTVTSDKEKKKRANAKYQRKFRKKNLRDVRTGQRDRHAELKLIVYNHYSNSDIKCACCNERGYKFLCLDHINNDGAEDRKMNPSHQTGKGLYTRLISEGFPEGFQLLCYNCNMSKAIYGKCPHKEGI